MAFQNAHVVTSGLGFPEGPVALPDGSVRPILDEEIWREGTKTTILDGDAKIRGSVMSNVERRYARGQPLPLRPLMWHHYVPRDEAGSRRLRGRWVSVAAEYAGRLSGAARYRVLERERRR